MDMIDILMAKSAAVNAAKDYTDQKTQSLMGGVIYKGEVDYYNDLPAAADVEEGWSYTVKYAGTSGTVADGTEYVWGKTSPNSELGWISFSKDCYSKAETDTLLAAEQEQIETNKNNISSVDSKMPIILAGRFPFSPDDCLPRTIADDGSTTPQPKRMLTPIFMLPKNTKLRFAPLAHIGEYDNSGNFVRKISDVASYTAEHDIFIQFAAKNSLNSEMGVADYKELLHNIFIERIDTLSTGYNYMGAPIHLGNYFVRTAKNFSGNGQDGAIYGDFMFFCNDSCSCKVVQISTQETIATFYLDQYETILPHCNTVVFGNKYDISDKFPLLYVNAYNNTNLPKGTVYVHRIITDSNGLPTGTTLIQTITIGFTANSIWTDGNDVRPYGNFFVDTDNGYLYAYTLKDSDNITRFFKFVLPDISTLTVTLQTTDIIEQFDAPYMEYIQGNTYHGGKAYILGGLGTASSTGYLYVINLQSAKIISKVDFANTTGNLEPEFISAYYDKLIMGNSTAYEYTFS